MQPCDSYRPFIYVYLRITPPMTYTQTIILQHRYASLISIMDKTGDTEEIFYHHLSRQQRTVIKFAKITLLPFASYQ